MTFDEFMNGVQFWLPAALYLLLLIYVFVFGAIAYHKGKKYLNIPIPSDTVVETVRHLQTFSLTIAGLAFAALALILSIDIDERPHAYMDLIIFFSIGVFFELMAALIPGSSSKILGAYLGTVLEYGGLLSIINGFFIYILEISNGSYQVWLTYLAGIAVYLGLISISFSKHRKVWGNYKKKNP